MKIFDKTFNGYKVNYGLFDSMRDVQQFSWVPEVAEESGLKPDYVDNFGFKKKDQTRLPWYSGINATKEDCVKHCINVFSSGWEEGAKRVKAMADKIEKALAWPHKDSMNYEVNRYTGTRLQVNRYLNNDDKCFSRIKIEKLSGLQKIRICQNSSILSYETQEVLFMRTAPALAAISILENLGYSVAIDAFCASHSINEGIITNVTAREHGYPLNMAAAAGILCSVAFTRNGMFHCYDYMNVPHNSGYGTAFNYGPEKLAVEHLEPLYGGLPENIIISDANICDEKGMIDHCKNIIKTVTGGFDD